MTHRICLLRGVNVGGVKVPMAELKAIAAEAGFADPRTLLASGNLVVEGDAAPDVAAEKLEAGIEAHFGRRIEVVVRTPEQWAGLIAANPFPEQAAENGSKLLVMIMKDAIKPGALESLRALAAGEEQVEAAGGDLFFWHPDGIGRSKMAEKALPRLIGLGTGRNWNTVLKLADMVGLKT
ncbi:DUF1697 domain-containing protein [Brevundimonas lenta]|uniref:Uncharacterized protein (DUF1697 family) n=1 Tax=Brevundimonas lenta TaxID=424796 RepID=A0A7W6JFP9_9CAUL|nr:DUF1697 domain-containing protein [Brevundimonas lenta]MBB4084310.1 uncharacterized protein (DUF1697 family) [Brevundimonas lenta]